jgi:tetratricopeptide (TPR) repeat protein
MKGAEYFPSQPASLTFLGCIHEWDKDYEKANDAFDRALEVSIESDVRMMALLNKGRALCSVGEFEKSLVIYQEYLDAGGEPTASVLATMGIVCYFLGELEKSLNLFQSCLEQNQQGTFSLAGRFVAQVLYALGTNDHKALARQQVLHM